MKTRAYVMLEGTIKVEKILQQIDQLLPILRTVSKDLHVLSKDLRCLTDKQIAKDPEQIRNKRYPRRIFLRDKLEEAWLRRYEENEQSWKNIRCCKNQFFKHDKDRGEVVCTNCGEVIVQRTFGQGGRKGADQCPP